VNQLDQFRSRRRQVYEKLFSARVLFIAGFLIMPALLFNPNVLFRILQFLFFWFLAWLSGKKNNPLFTFLVILGIVIFNLIIPYGQVLFSTGIFKITSGALMTGIQRAVTLEGLIMLSRFTIRQDLKIPGFFGELIGESFRIFAVIMNQKQHITRKNLIGDIDRLMLNLSAADASPPAVVPASGTKPAGFVILAFVVILSWLPWAIFLTGGKFFAFIGV
jgi:heptaprenyl diphosphate synthase